MTEVRNRRPEFKLNIVTLSMQEYFSHHFKMFYLLMSSTLSPMYDKSFSNKEKSLKSFSTGFFFFIIFPQPGIQRLTKSTTNYLFCSVELSA